MIENRETWKFAVIGSDSRDLPQYLGFVNDREEAEKLRKTLTNPFDTFHLVISLNKPSPTPVSPFP